MSFCGRTRYNLLSKCKIEQWLCVVDIWNGICSQHIQSLFTRFLFSWCYFFVEAGLQVLWVRIYIYSVFLVDRWTPMCVVLLYIILPLKFHQKLKEKEYQINIISLCISIVRICCCAVNWRKDIHKLFSWTHRLLRNNDHFFCV